MLLMATPYADTAHAYNVVLTAASANDSSTPDQPPGHGLHGAMDAPQRPNRATALGIRRRSGAMRRIAGHTGPVAPE